MADIVFLLLIFFMLTTAFATKEGIEIQLPETESSETIAPKNITIRIDSEGGIYLDTYPSLRTLWAQLLTTRFRSKRAVFAATGLRKPPQKRADLAVFKACVLIHPRSIWVVGTRNRASVDGT